jgi:hypothetical protein
MFVMVVIVLLKSNLPFKSLPEPMRNFNQLDSGTGIPKILLAEPSATAHYQHVQLRSISRGE